ncbi:unnamed protein product [Bemisia tabaci]|uniref:Uncharacterized protein n=1 Tax=Bemisia tabaci TaxID=7038 RepID=A0A9P0A5B8_BEMTA|nr:unnamed protein product [Bemisia tabaci]
MKFEGNVLSSEVSSMEKIFESDDLNSEKSLVDVEGNRLTEGKNLVRSELFSSVDDEKILTSEDSSIEQIFKSESSTVEINLNRGNGGGATRKNEMAVDIDDNFWNIDFGSGNSPGLESVTNEVKQKSNDVQQTSEKPPQMNHKLRHNTTHNERSGTMKSIEDVPSQKLNEVRTSPASVLKNVEFVDGSDLKPAQIYVNNTEKPTKPRKKAEINPRGGVSKPRKQHHSFNPVSKRRGCLDVERPQVGTERRQREESPERGAETREAEAERLEEEEIGDPSERVVRHDVVSGGGGSIGDGGVDDWGRGRATGSRRKEELAAVAGGHGGVGVVGVRVRLDRVHVGRPGPSQARRRQDPRDHPRARSHARRRLHTRPFPRSR